MLENLEIIMNVTNSTDLQYALKMKINTIYIKEETIGKSFLVLGKIQSGHLPISILERIEANRSCKISVGGGIIVPVTKDLAEIILQQNEMLEENAIEIDIEDVHNIKVNLYYAS